MLSDKFLSKFVVIVCHLRHKGGFQTSPYDLYCVGGTLSLTQSINQSRRQRHHQRQSACALCGQETLPASVCVSTCSRSSSSYSEQYFLTELYVKEWKRSPGRSGRTWLSLVTHSHRRELRLTTVYRGAWNALCMVLS